MLPLSVLERAGAEITNYHGSGMSVMEMSHRSKVFIQIFEETQAKLRRLMKVPDNYKILFLQTGATGQFSMIPLNLIGKTGRADYAVTGNFSNLAYKEAQKYGQISLAASSEDRNHTYIPSQDQLKLDPEASYFYYCANNTVYGTEWQYVPETGSVPLVCDMSSDILSRPVDVSKVGIIYDSSDDYSTGLYNGFKAKAAELGVEIVATTSFTADNKADLSTQVTQCQDAGADLVFLPIYYTEASQILTYANRISYAPKFFGCDGMDGILTVEGFDTSLAEGLALMTPFDANATNEATQSFVAKFKEKMDGLVPNQFAADGYDVIYAIYDAMTAAGITGNESASEICDALKAQFATMTVDGLTGTGMHWDENGMISKAPAAVVIENGVYVPMA